MTYVNKKHGKQALLDEKVPFFNFLEGINRIYGKTKRFVWRFGEQLIMFDSRVARSVGFSGCVDVNEFDAGRVSRAR